MRIIDWIRKPETYKLLRIEAGALAVIGLAFFYGAAVLAPNLGWDSPALIWKTGLVLACLGFLLLAGLVAWVYPKSQKLTFETVMGFLGLLASLISLLGAIGDAKSGVQVFWLVMAIILFPSSWALIALTALRKRKPQVARPAVKQKEYKRMY